MTQDDEEQTKALKYNELIPMITKAIQEVEEENETLKAENETVKKENEQLREKLTALADRQEAIEDMLLALSTDFPKEKLANLGKTTTSAK